MRVGILKPDHLGDLVLAAPAVAALGRHFADVRLFCHPATAPLARHLFPGLPLRPVLLPHLDKTRRLPLETRPLAGLRGEVDFLVCLRWDNRLQAHLDDAGIDYHASGLDVLDLHVSVEQQAVVAAVAPPYDPLTSYVYAKNTRTAERPRRVRTVGLCVSAGFDLNAWPLCHWLALAERLHERGARVVLVGGPNEALRLGVLAAAAADSLGYPPRVLVGGPDFGAFLRQLAEAVDLVIATDSGTAHLASLVCPVLSLFGGSPWRRYAPLGRANAVITRQLPCSPCRQFDRTSVNTCHTQECLTRLTPEQVEACLDVYLSGAEAVRPRLVAGAWLAEAPWAA